MIPPAVGGLIAYITARIGIAGRLQKLEALQRELELHTKLAGQPSVDSKIKAKCIARMNEIAEEFFAEEPDLVRTNAPRPWRDFPFYRRWVFLPFGKSFSGWMAIIFYYYVMTGFCVIAFETLRFDPDTSDRTSAELSSALVGFLVFLALIRLWVRASYRTAYARDLGRLQARRRVAEASSP